MRERAETWLKAACGVLVAVLLFQLARALILHSDPFAHVTIPALPVLASATNAPVSATSGQPALGQVPGNGLASAGTNLPHGGTNQTGTNLVMKSATTNLVVNSAATNSGTNLPPALAAVKATTNSVSGDKLSPPLTEALTNSLGASNAPALAGTNHTGTNGLATAGRKKSRSHRPAMMGMGFPGMGGGAPLPEFPPVVKNRIDQIVNSELLGPVMHPQPMGLMGIAGDEAFLRAGTGETGLVKVGDTLGDLKLLRIGINRVLVEQNGQKQELTIFNGMGGESLLTTPDKNSNETTNH